jgi:uncharacterized protein (DUF1800 family)
MPGIARVRLGPGAWPGAAALRALARRGAAAGLLAVLAVLAACGSGGGAAVPAPGDAPASREEAARFLTQATFGPTEAEIARVTALGYRAWIDEQFALPAFDHKAAWEASDRALKAADPADAAGSNEVLHAFYAAALGSRDQLRQRVAFALSQILVVSLQDGNVGNMPRGAAHYLDVLARGAGGNYRQLLEDVSLHPIMGQYLTHLRNRKADPTTGRVPDENYAREVMQLFTIGLVQLDAQGRPRLVNGAPVETYTADDIAGLARVFTGFSWGGPSPATPADLTTQRFNASTGARHEDRDWRPMLGYPQFHSPEAKTFLGLSVPAQASADPDASLKAALDHLFAHPNVGPFIGRQLIQRLVTSNPSPAYVGRVAAAFADNGAGVRGDMKAVVRAVLLDPEARSDQAAAQPGFGKLREPVLRMTAYLRAYGARSSSGRWRIGSTDNPGGSLGQSPLRADSVFNFYRPGYVAPGSETAAQGLVAPELQITHETSVAGYANFMKDVVSSGVGSSNPADANRRDVQVDVAPALALVERPSAAAPTELVDDVDRRLMHGTMSPALKDAITAAVATVRIPALNAGGTNQASIDTARLNRARLAIYLALVSPEFIALK